MQFNTNDKDLINRNTTSQYSYGTQTKEDQVWICKQKPQTEKMRTDTSV